MPSKTYFAMAAGSALVAVSPPGTDLAAVVQAAGCGIHVPPRNAKALADAIRRLSNDASYLEQCKVNSRRAAVREFDRARLVQRFADHLQEAFSRRSLRSPTSRGPAFVRGSIPSAGAVVPVVQYEFRDPVLSSCCPGAALAAWCRSSRLKLLAPGGFVHEHRDITGVSPMGVLRLHVPIVTDPDVEFDVNGKRVPLLPGEAWVLDTSYRHRVVNNSTVRRVHLVVDVELHGSLLVLSPARDVWARLHDVHFCLPASSRASSMLRSHGISGVTAVVR